MNTYLVIASGLTLLAGLVHSTLGEALILKGLTADRLPELLGSADFTRQVLRLFWHAVTIAWGGIAAVLLFLAQAPKLDPALFNVGAAFAAAFLATGLYALVQTRGRHFAWVFQLVIAAFTWLGVQGAAG
ncbi:MAG: hypothetical protein AAGN66_15200 [Acidobacteriota bacterium]